MSSVAVPRSTGALWGALAALVAGILVSPLLLVVLASSMLGNSSGDASGPVADIPPHYLELYRAAGAAYDVDWAILAAIGKIESDHGRSNAAGVKSGVNFAGCCAGPMQFSIIPRPSTWDHFGVDGDHDGQKDVYSPDDAIPAAGRYLVASGAPGDYHRAILAYNHSEAYYQQVMARAQEYRDAASAAPGDSTDVPIGGGDWLAPVPGMPGEQCDARIIPDVVFLIRRYHLLVTDCFSNDPVHAAGGEHPLGLATDVVPGAGGSWDDVDQLAAWAEPQQNQPRAPFRWVGYNGDPNHGRGNHLHLSWNHGPAKPAETVQVFNVP